MSEQERDMTESPYLTVKEAALYLHISPRTIYLKVSNKSIPFRRAGGTLLFHRDEIDAWTKEQEEAKPEGGRLRVASIR